MNNDNENKKDGIDILAGLIVIGAAVLLALAKSKKVKVPINTLNSRELATQMTQALANENYEYCEEIQKEFHARGVQYSVHDGKVSV